MEVSIYEQLKNFFKQPGFYTKLQHRFDRNKEHHLAIEDVYDGKLYKELMKPGAFLNSPFNISFQWNTDGVSLFHSSNYSMWPIIIFKDQ